MTAPDVRRPRRRRRRSSATSPPRCSTASRPPRPAARCRRSASPAASIADAAPPRARPARRRLRRSTGRGWSSGGATSASCRADSDDRNARQAREALLDHVGVDPANVHEVPASDEVGDRRGGGRGLQRDAALGGRRLLRGADARHRPRRPLRLALPRPPGARRPRRDRRRRPRLPEAPARPGHPDLRGDGPLPRRLVPRQRRGQGRRRRPRPRRPSGSVARDPRPRRHAATRPSGGSTPPPPPTSPSADRALPRAPSALERALRSPLSPREVDVRHDARAPELGSRARR